MYFSRTTRALTASQPYALVGSLVLAALLMLAWLAWFWGAELIVPATGRIVTTTGDGYVQAVFTETLTAPLQAGQSAVIHFQGGAAPAAGPVHATVVEVTSQAGETMVGLYADLNEANAVLFAQPLAGTVVVAVERLSPAIYFLRASGQFIDSPPVVFNR